MKRKTLAEQCAERKAMRIERIAILKTHGMRAHVRQRLIRSYYMAARNSQQRGIEFKLSTNDLLRLANRADGQCEITGIRFEVVETSRKWDRQPWTASIDRIDCSKGYTFDNCRLVCAAVNVALNSWGESVLERIVDAMVERRLRQSEGYMATLREFHVKHRRRIRYLKKRSET
jgi:hypothetical protein